MSRLLRPTGAFRSVQPSGVCGTIAIAGGSLILAGWLLGIESLKSGYPGLVAVKANSAVCFVLAGLVLRHASSRTHRTLRTTLATACSALVVLAGVLTLAEYGTGIDLRIDQLIVTEERTRPQDAPGRMAVTTAVAFSTVGIALLLVLRRRPPARAATDLLAGVTLLSVAPWTIGYAYDAARFAPAALSYTPIGLPATILFIVVAVGIVSIGREDAIARMLSAHTASAITMRRLFPAAVGFPLAFGALMLYVQRAGHFADALAFALFATANGAVVGGLVWWNARVLDRAESQLSEQVAALHESERRYRSIFDHVPVSIWEEDWRDVIAAVDGARDAGVSDFKAYFEARPEAVAALLRRVRIVDVNPETVGMFHARDKAEMLESLETVFATPDTLPGFVGELAALGAGQPVYRTEMALRTVPGELITVLLTMTFPEPGSRSGRVLVSLMDITGRRVAEEQLRVLNAELERRVQARTSALETANHELESFTYSVSHDLRAPLRAMQGFATILLEEHAGEIGHDASRCVRRIADNARQMGALVDDLLRLSRVGRQTIRSQRVNVCAVVRQALEQVSAEREGRDVEIRLGELSPCYGDAALLRQAMINLLSNALKFTRKQPHAVIEIGMDAAADAPPGQQAFFVRDNGVGFDIAYAGKLFGIFQRLHSTDEYEGTGVGLAIVQRIIARHGGRVWADAQVDRGATFRFTLPTERSDGLEDR